MEQKIESILFYKNEPVALGDLSVWLEVSESEVLEGLETLKNSLSDRGIVLLENREQYSLATSPDSSLSLIHI